MRKVSRYDQIPKPFSLKYLEYSSYGTNENIREEFSAKFDKDRKLMKIKNDIALCSEYLVFVLHFRKMFDFVTFWNTHWLGPKYLERNRWTHNTACYLFFKQWSLTGSEHKPSSSLDWKYSPPFNTCNRLCAYIEGGIVSSLTWHGSAVGEGNKMDVHKETGTAVKWKLTFPSPMILIRLRHQRRVFGNVPSVNDRNEEAIKRLPNEMWMSIAI